MKNGGFKNMAALTTTQIAQLNKSDKASQSASAGTKLSQLSKITQTVTRAQMTDSGGVTGTFTLTDGTIPAGATVLYSAVTSVNLGFTGDTSAVLTLGDGTDVDRYNTSTVNVFATAAGGISAGAPSGVVYHTAAKSIIVTITSATDFTNVVAGSVTISLYYLA